MIFKYTMGIKEMNNTRNKQYEYVKAAQRSVFWAFVRIIFVVSAGISWFNAFTSMKGREVDLHAAESRALIAEHANTVLQTRLAECTSPKK